jgi:NAD(P)-dependent dehydrogenase (short-subunit alcohol dehydrogenase family)
VYARGFGVSSVETGEPVAPATLFRIGSTTKMVTGLTAALLAEEGKLALDAPVGRCARGLDPALAGLTLDQLLTHRGGRVNEAAANGPHDDAALGARVRAWGSEQRFAPPGDVYSYSGPGYWLAGYAIEQAAGGWYADAVRARGPTTSPEDARRMDFGLRGRRALVTGSTAGIGWAVARALAAEGAEVTLNGRTEARVAGALAALRTAVPGAVAGGVAADLGTAEGCAALAAACPDVDVLVNNVGIFAPRPFEEIADAEWMRFVETNVMSGVRLSRHYLPAMRARDWGRVVFVSSESALQIPTEMIHYGMTKTAQLAVARGLAETLRGTGVTVNSVLPGPTASEGVGALVAQLAAARGVDRAEAEREFFATARPSSVIQRFATPGEVAAMVAYVCSAQASATTGAALRVDGGVVRAIP